MAYGWNCPWAGVPWSNDAVVQLSPSSPSILVTNLVGAIGTLFLVLSNGCVAQISINNETTPGLAIGIGAGLSITPSPDANACGLNIVGSQLLLIPGASFSGSYKATYFGFASVAI
jgi:apolipoprotein N-acyltransferase